MSGRRCRDLCKGQRGALESPAQLVRTKAGGLAVYCPCCLAFLDYQRELTTTPSGLIVEARPANIHPDVEATSLRFVDTVCGYDHVLLKDLRPRDPVLAATDPNAQRVGSHGQVSGHTITDG